MYFREIPWNMVIESMQEELREVIGFRGYDYREEEMKKLIRALTEVFNEVFIVKLENKDFATSKFLDFVRYEIQWIREGEKPEENWEAYAEANGFKFYIAK